MGIFLAAETDGGAALGVAIGAVVTAITGGVVVLLTKTRENRAADRKDAIGGLQDLVKQLEAQNERRDTVIGQQQKAIEVMWRSETSCREALSEARASIHFLYDMIVRLHATLRKAGVDPGDLPELPDVRDRHEPDAAFLARQSQQSVELLRQVDSSIIIKSPPTK